MTTPDPRVNSNEVRRDVERKLAETDPEKLRRLIEDIYQIPPWWTQEPMGRA